jgi:signal transduction histidine kinase/DNA-binding NarL/FixJ family response regulator
LITANESGSRLFVRFAAVNRAITTSLDFEELLKLVVRNARELVGADAALLLLADEDEVLRVRAAEGVDAELFSGISERMNESTVERVRAILRPTGEGGFSAPPVMVDRSVSGLLAVARDEPFQAEEEWVLSALADQAAIALRNAKLHEMEIERGRAEALERLAEESVRLLTSEPQKRPYDDLLATICRITDAPRGVFWLLDATAPGEEFLFAASTCGFRRKPRDEFDHYALEQLRHLPLSSKVPSARAARLLKVVSEPDVGRHTAGGTLRIFRQMKIRSVLCVPVRARDRLFGVVTLLWPEAGASEKSGRQHNAEVIVSQVSAALDVSRLVEELTQANRSKDEFLATLSHELRNPLNVITGYSELLLRLPEARSSAKIQAAAAAIARSATAQDRLVSDLLDLSRLQMGKLSFQLQPLSLSAAIADAAEAVRADAMVKKIELEIDLPNEPLLCRADPTRVQQIAWNLLSNAVKFTPSGGRVRLALSRVGTEAQLVVEDTGEGIDSAFLPRVFEVFRQAEGGPVRRHGGMGIGLALVRQLTELHGGKVEASSAGIGRGAKFTVTLPLPDRSEVETEAGLPVESSPSISTVRVLVVDDSRETVAALHDLLESEGALVTTALSGAEGLRIAKEEDFDLVISDISMPEMDGYQFLQKLRSEAGRRSVTAVALTGFGRQEDILDARRAGFDRHLTKPVHFEELIQVIRDAMGGRRSPAVDRARKSEAQRRVASAPEPEGRPSP